MQTRAFIAILLPIETQRILDDLIRKLTPGLDSGFKWVLAHKIHLTLAFLGDCDEKQVRAASQAMQESAVVTSSFHLTIQGLGCFPHPRSPRVLWCGLQPPDALIAFQQHLAGHLAGAGFPLESRRFSPHLTLARIAEPLNGMIRARLGALLLKYRTEVFTQFHANQVALIKSDLRSAGAVYTVLKSANLKDNESKA